VYSPVTYSKPTSMSWHASVAFRATLLVHSSLPDRKSADSMFMYTSVDSMSLCPRSCFTCMMSCVRWYSMVPFQCLNVWKVIFISLGLFSFSASALRCVLKYSRSMFLRGWKIVGLFLGKLLIMPMSLLLTGRIRGLLFFSGVMFSVRLSVSRFIHSRSTSSPIRIPVSLSV